MRKIRWGIAGPGNIANKFAKAVKQVPCAELAAVASRDKVRAEAFAQTYSIPHVFGSYEQMAESDLVDAVYIATPHPFHKPCAEIFLKAGKHVLCEKPLCVNARQAQELKDCAQTHGVFLMEAMWTRFLPAIQKAKELITRGDIGDILGLEADFCYNLPEEEEPKIYQPHMAGGSLLDVGVYGLHFAAMFLGRDPEIISALAHTQGGVDIHTQVLLKYKGGAIASVSSAIGLEKPETAYIYGTKGRILFPRFYGAQALLVTMGNSTTEFKVPSMGDGFEEEIVEVCRCIEQGKVQSDVLPLDETIAMLKQMDAIRKQIGVSYPLEGEA